MRSHSQLIVGLIMGLLVIAGCASAPSGVLPQAPVHGTAAQRSAYTVQPGDIMDVKFFYNPELNETVQVRPDGFISLQLVDEIQVAGMEPKEISRKLSEQYARDLRKPVVSVIVKSFDSQRVYVGGEVNQQGLITMPAGLTVLQAVMQAGGFKATAEPSETLIIRKGANLRPVPMRVDLSALTSGTVSGQDIRLQPEDVVFVPKSAIAKADQFVNQYIEQLLLFRGVSFGFVYNINNNN